MTKPILRAVGLEPTNKCNLKCSMCWSQNPQLHPPRQQGFMNWQLYSKIMDELSDLVKGRTVALCMNYGGEGMLHPRYVDMLEYASEKGWFALRVITNGVVLTPEICKALVKHDVSVTVSIHNSPQLLKAYRNVSMLARLRQNKRKPLDGSIIVSEFEGKELRFQLEQWTKICDEVRVYPLMTEDLHYVNFSQPNHLPCTQPTYYMGILWNGDVYPCCHLLSTSFKGMGNVAETSVTKVWDGERYGLLRQGQLSDAPCGKCEFW